MKQLIFFLLLTFNLNAQFKWSFEDRSFVSGELVEARVWVSGFDSVGAFQYSFEYDTNKLAIRLDTPFTFTGLIPYTADEFSHGLQPGCSSAKNEIRTVWADPYVHTYPNGHVYSVWFIAKQTGTICESVKVLNGPLPIEAWHENLVDPVNMIIGCIQARKPRKTIPGREDILSTGIRIYPNPTSDHIYVDSTEPVYVQVINQVGQVTFENYIYSQDQPIFIESGINYVRIKTSTKTIVKQAYKN